MTPQELNNLRVLVVGAGVTGCSVMRYLAEYKISFDVTDARAEPTSMVSELLANGRYLAGLEVVVPEDYDVMVLSPGIPRAHPMISAAVAANVPVIGDVELFASAVDGDVIAITGSNGKSTVASMAAHVLERAGRRVELCGNIGTAVLDVLLKNQQDKQTEQPVYVLELSSYQLESLNSLAPLSAVVLNISDDHLDRYDSMTRYAATKRHVYTNAKFVVANANDAQTHPALPHEEVLWFSQDIREAKSETSAQFSKQDQDGKPALCVGEELVLLASELKVPGEHNVANALAVIALLHPLKLTMNELKQGLASFRGLEHRTELVLENKGVCWYNDSKGTNVDACIKAIKAMPSKVVLIAGGQGKGVDFTPLRAVVSERVKAVVLIGEDAPKLRKALEGSTELFDVDSMQQAVELSMQLAKSGDAVLLSPACASFDMFENYQMRGRQFCESVERTAA